MHLIMQTLQVFHVINHNSYKSQLRYIENSQVKNEHQTVITQKQRIQSVMIKLYKCIPIMKGQQHLQHNT